MSQSYKILKTLIDVLRPQRRRSWWLLCATSNSISLRSSLYSVHRSSPTYTALKPIRHVQHVLLHLGSAFWIHLSARVQPVQVSIWDQTPIGCSAARTASIQRREATVTVPAITGNRAHRCLCKLLRKGHRGWGCQSCSSSADRSNVHRVLPLQ
jgi:hypothetical protein